MKLSNTPSAWSARLTEVLSVLAYLSLATTGEIESTHWIPFLVLLPIQWFFRFRLSVFWTTLSLISMVAFSVFAILLRDTAPVTALVNVSPFFILVLGFSANASALMGWRVGLGFIALTLSAAINSDFLLPVLVTVYVLTASVALSCAFLAGEFSRNLERFSYLKDMELPARFLTRSFFQAFAVLLTAFVIFPMLPRMPQGMGVGSSKSSQTGYTESVNLRSWAQYDPSGDSQVVLRIYNRSSQAIDEMIPRGLLRSRVLSILTPDNWLPLPVKEVKEETGAAHAAKQKPKTNQLHFIREGISTYHLPVPYGTEDVASYFEGMLYVSNPTVTGEWTDRLLRHRKIEYRVDVRASGESRMVDPPKAILLQVPPVYQTKRMLQLKEQVFRRAKTVSEKIAAAQNYLTRAEFLPSTPGIEENKIGEKENPIDHFLFVSKKGHCELFSTSAAILLRLAGVPTRLISGFRVGRFGSEQIISVRMGDAHAWIEAYDPQFGWIPLDLTPRILYEPSVSEWLRDKYDFLSAYWYDHVLSYGERTPTVTETLTLEFMKFKQSFYRKWSQYYDRGTVEWGFFLVIFCGVSILFSLLALRFYRISRKDRLYASADYALVRERNRFESLLNKRSEIQGSDQAKSWMQDYERLRFGPKDPQVYAVELGHLKNRRQELSRRA